MAGPIYKAFWGRPTEAWYALSESAQRDLMAKVGPEDAGGRTIVMCSCAWSNERYLYFGIEEYPDIEAVQRATGALLAVDWYRYADAASILGTRSGSSPEITATGPVFKLALWQYREALYHVSAEDMSAGQERRRENTRRAAARNVLTCDCAWSNERWRSFGLMEFPDAEAVQQFAQGHLDMDHYRYVDSISILGTRHELS